MPLELEQPSDDIYILNVPYIHHCFSTAVVLTFQLVTFVLFAPPPVEIFTEILSGKKTGAYSDTNYPYHCLVIENNGDCSDYSS